MSNNLFYGPEVEGPERGEMTLFIPKNAENRMDFLVEANKKGIKRLYFGAGNDRGTNIPNYLLQAIPSHFSVYLEITDYHQLIGVSEAFLRRTNIIYVVLQTTDIKKLPAIFKIERQNDVQWYENNKPIVSDINDPLYKQDVIIHKEK